MIRKGNFTKTFLVYLIILGFIFMNCVALKADESITYMKAELSERYIHYNEVIGKYGEIWIGYVVAHDKITADSGEERFIIERAYYYYKKDGNYILLGSVDKAGLYDKNGICLKEPSRIASGYLVAGISSSLNEDILGIRLILQSESESNSWRETESVYIIDFDTQQDTIRLMDMSRFFGP